MTCADMPADVNVSDATAVGQFLGRTLREMSLENARVTMSASRGQAVLKPLSLPPGTADGELAGMVQYQVSRELPFGQDEAVIDFTIERHYDADVQPGAPQGRDVLVAAVTVPVVDFYRKVAEEAGVRLVRLGLRPYADAKCVEMCRAVDGSQRVAIVHVTADETEIDILVGASLAFSRSAFVKIPAFPSGTVPQAEAAVGAVVTEVVRSLQSFQTIERGGRIDRILVAGGTGIERQVADLLSRRSAVPCEMFKPGTALGLDEGVDTSGFISALGLAAAPARRNALPFDFLSPKRPAAVRDMRKIRLAAISGAAALLAVVGLAVGVGRISSRRSDVNRLREEHNRLKEANRAVAALEKRVRQIDSWNAQADWLDHWAYLSGLFPPAQDAYVTSLRSNADGTLSVAVQATGQQVISHLVTRLQNAGYTVSPGPVSPTRDRYGYAHGSVLKLSIARNMNPDLRSVSLATRPADDSPRGVALARGGGAPSARRDERPPTASATPTAAAAPAAAPSAGGQNGVPNLRNASFDAFAPGTQGLDRLTGQYASFRATLGEARQDFLISSVNGADYVCHEVYDRESNRAILAYFRKDSRGFRALESQKNRAAGANRDITVKFYGKAHFIPTNWQSLQGRTACPVAVIVDWLR